MRHTRTEPEWVRAGKNRAAAEKFALNFAARQKDAGMIIIGPVFSPAADFRETPAPARPRIRNLLFSPSRA